MLAVIVCLIYIFVIRKTKSKNSSTINKPNSDPSTEPKICGDGYFIPDDDETLKDCQKCSLEGCQKCNGTYEKNDCYSCGSLQSIYNNNKIIKCENTCETGDEEKCLTCDNNKAECQSCNIGYQLVKGKCKSEYVIKVTYLTMTPNEEIELTDMDTLYIKKMMIDGENVSPTKSYNFPEKGNHTVYFRFSLWTIVYYYYLFSGKKRIISATFLNFDEYIPCFSFHGMFSGCTNLISVDISKISFKLDKMEYQFTLNEMFKDCINLKYVKLYNIPAINADKMFYNCKSLVSIDLSNINTNYFNSAESMFYNCISLKSINFKSFHLNSVTTINYMFYNCISLETIDLSSFKPDALVYMENVFGNCISLTSIIFSDFDTHNVKYMDYLFYNCTSLKYINLTNFNTKSVKNLSYIFAYCTSLEAIDISRFETIDVKDMSSMFFHCHSLKSIDLLSFITDNVEDNVFSL